MKRSLWLYLFLVSTASVVVAGFLQSFLFDSVSLHILNRLIQFGSIAAFVATISFIQLLIRYLSDADLTTYPIIGDDFPSKLVIVFVSTILFITLLSAFLALSSWTLGIIRSL